MKRSIFAGPEEIRRMLKAMRGVAAVLSADAASYSRLMGDDARATMNTPSDCRNVLKAHIADHAAVA